MCTDIHRNQTLTVVFGQEMNRMSGKMFVFSKYSFHCAQGRRTSDVTKLLHFCNPCSTTPTGSQPVQILSHDVVISVNVSLTLFDPAKMSHLLQVPTWIHLLYIPFNVPHLLAKGAKRHCLICLVWSLHQTGIKQIFGECPLAPHNGRWGITADERRDTSVLAVLISH